MATSGVSNGSFDNTTAYGQVNTIFDQALALAEETKTEAASFINALNSSIYAPPSLTVSWSSLAAPSIPEVGGVPDLATVAFVIPDSPEALSLADPSFTIDDFTEDAPTLSLPAQPTITYGSIPTVPAIGEVTVPDAPFISTPATPSYLAINTVAFGGIDIRQDMLDQLSTIPTMTLAAPTPFSFSRGPDYESVLLSAIQSKIGARLNGGTGLDPAVEQAIWDRSRDRETKIAQANVDEVMRKSESLGFRLPTGALSAQLRQAEQNYYDKLSELSRDISVKQADLEQENLKQAIATGIQLEGQLIDQSIKLEQLSFETAKAYADNAVVSYNAQVDNYKALLSAYQTYADAYKTVIQAELARVEAYKAELQGEQTKAQINTNLVEQYKATIEAGMSQVEIYKAQISAAQTLVGLEQAKIGAAGEQIKAYVATVNAETSKVEAFKAGVEAEATKVEIYKTKAQAFSAKVSAQAERSRAEVARYSALYQAKASEWEGYRAVVSAESEKAKAISMQNTTVVDGYRAGATAITAKAEIATKVWETQIKQYEAGQNISLVAAKANNDALIATNAARLDAAKVGAQVYAQLSSSAYSMIHAAANISGSQSDSTSTNVNKSYSFEATNVADIP